MHYRGWFCVVAVTASVLFAETAGAQPPPREITLDYDAPPSCPDAEAFRAAIEARLRASPVRVGRPALELWVRLTETPTKVVGKVAMGDGRGMNDVREIEGTTCAEVVSALGLFVAFAVDLEAEAHADPAPISATEEKRGPVDSPRAARPRVAIGPEPTAREWTAEAGAHVGAAAMIGPDMTPIPLPFLGAGLERRPSASTPAAGAELAPRIRLAFVRGSQSLTTGSGGASFRVTAGQIDLCPVGLRLSRTLAIRPCPTAQIGAVEASGSGVADAQVDVRAWLLVGVLARVEWEVIRHWVVEAQGGALVAAVRHRYYVDPDTTLYRMPIVGGIVSGGLAIRLP